MAIIQEIENENFTTKPAITSIECEKMLDEALEYIGRNSPRQAGIMHEQFYEILRIIERMPGIGTIYKNGMRKNTSLSFSPAIFISILCIMFRGKFPGFQDRLRPRTNGSRDPKI